MSASVFFNLFSPIPNASFPFSFPIPGLARFYSHSLPIPISSRSVSRTASSAAWLRVRVKVRFRVIVRVIVRLDSLTLGRLL